jgi:hypothetical protein
MHFLDHKSPEIIAAFKKQKDFFNFFPDFSADFAGGVPYPLCTPNSTQGHPRPPKAGAPTRAMFAWWVEG